MSLHAIAYVSTAARDLSEADLDVIVRESRRLNAASGITGVLLHCDGNFMQFLEGHPDAVAETWARIRTSRRHHQVNEMMNLPVDRREFSGWTMGFSDASPTEFLDLAAMPWGDGERIGPGRQMLQVFWRNCRTCAAAGF